MLGPPFYRRFHNGRWIYTYVFYVLIIAIKFLFDIICCVRSVAIIISISIILVVVYS